MRRSIANQIREVPVGANNRESVADVSISIETNAGSPAARIKKDMLNRAEHAKAAAASGLQRTAASLHARTDQFSDFGHSAADRIQASADYVHDIELEGLVLEVRDLLRRHPAELLLGAAFLGFIVGRSMGRAR